jgi:hypothetical protein
MRLRRYLVCSMQGYFPVVVKTGANSLAVVFRTGGTHVAITGTLAVSTSHDGGKSWSDPVEVQPRWDDARNPAFGVNSKGELVVSYWLARLHAYREDPQDKGFRWDFPKDDERLKTVPALYYCRSADGGRSPAAGGQAWSKPESYLSRLLTFASPYGRIITAPDGTLLMPVYGYAREPIADVLDVSILLRSSDDGKTWGDETLVAAGFNETSYAFLPDGTLLAVARGDTWTYTAILRSNDLGRTWSAPERVTRDADHPADLTVLQSGRLLLTFGRRWRPMGCGALLSDDGGRTWNTDREVLLAGDAVEDSCDPDCGYPSTVQLDDGHIVTLLYYASGSDMSGPLRHPDWGRVSCQAIHYREEDLR